MLTISENRRKNAVASNPLWWVLPTADFRYKNNTPKSVLQPKVIVFTKGYFKTAQQRGRNLEIVCTTYSV